MTCTPMLDHLRRESCRDKEADEESKYAEEQIVAALKVTLRRKTLAMLAHAQIRAEAVSRRSVGDADGEVAAAALEYLSLVRRGKRPRLPTRL